MHLFNTLKKKKVKRVQKGEYVCRETDSDGEVEAENERNDGKFKMEEQKHWGICFFYGLYPSLQARLNDHNGYCCWFWLLYCCQYRRYTLIMISFSCSFLFSQAKNKKEYKPLDLNPTKKRWNKFLHVRSWENSKLYNIGKISLIQSPGKILVKVLVHKEKELSKHWHVFFGNIKVTSIKSIVTSTKKKGNIFHIFKE